MNDLLQQPFTFPDVAGRKVLVLGLGGGCDIILAYAVARALPNSARAVIYANTKRAVEHDAERLSEHVYRLPGNAHTPLRKGRTHGSTTIDRSVPRGDENCPLIFVLRRQATESQLANEIKALGLDLIFGIDTGGDSLVEVAKSGDDDRDKRMLRVLEQTAVPLYHIVAAPGSDGESSSEAIRTTFRDHAARNRYRGCFALGPLFPVLRSLSTGLNARRTPRIILAAAAGELKSNSDGIVGVPRGIKPVVPREWLLHAFVFADVE
jgi:hypothetical protein